MLADVAVVDRVKDTTNKFWFPERKTAGHTPTSVV